MKIVLKLVLNLFDLGIYWYYLNTILKKHKVSKGTMVVCVLSLAVGWTVVNQFENRIWNLSSLLSVLVIITILFQGTLKKKLVLLTLFVGLGIILEPMILVFLRVMKYDGTPNELYKYYFVIALAGFMRGNLIYLLCKGYRLKHIRFSMIPKEIAGILLVVPVVVVLNCCFTVDMALEAGTQQSLIVCVCIIVASMLSYYFMLYMMERFSQMLQKRYEDEMYREEMKYKEMYYMEVEERNDYVYTLKHNMKNKLLSLYSLVDEGKNEQLKQELDLLSKEMGERDWRIYCENPVVNSVLQVKLGIAREREIRKDIVIQIPKQMKLELGDIGVLYGNLLDNAIEACEKLPKEQRFLKLENKYISGKLILILSNSKQEKNAGLRTTKEDQYMHGKGISSVRKVVEKYNGTVDFQDKGKSFEVSVMLYGIEAQG
ncbi:MAG: ATP-binding protein [Clostridia bacterium]|nr:ATP-binding protein [Clostridia bacterium]